MGLLQIKKKNKSEELDDRKDFFVVCDKCNYKTFSHLGYMEYPKGKYTFNIKCDGCGLEFQHIFFTATFRKEEQLKKAKGMLNPYYISKVAKIVKDKLTEVEDK